MIGFLRLFSVFFLRSRASLAAENLALRHQLGVLSRSAKRPRLRPRDRVLWVWLSRLCRDWRSWLVIVQPETVVRWHRQGFREYWAWKSHGQRRGRPSIDPAVRNLIRNMSTAVSLHHAPALRHKRLRRTPAGEVVLQLKTPYRKSTGPKINRRATTT